MEQKVKLPPVMLAFHIGGPSRVSAALFPDQLPATLSGKAAEDGAGALASAAHMEDWMGSRLRLQ